jgi:uncharacterized protein (DUF927 family)
MNDLSGAFAPLSPEEAASAASFGPAPQDDPWTTITPIPPEAFPLDVKLNRKDPDWIWIFRDADERPLGVECRWLVDGQKETRFATWCRHSEGRLGWRLKHLPALRPMFGLDRLVARPAAPVLVVEGPKKCAPAERIFTDYVAVSWPAGSKSAHLVNWSPLEGRDVIIWPDNDDAGRDAAAKISNLATAAGAISALVVPVPRDFPPKWDLADEAPIGADLHALLAAARHAQSEGRYPYPYGFKMLDRGLVWSDPSDEEKPEVVVAGKFEVVAESRDEAGWSWGVLLRWSDPDGRVREWAMPRSVLAGDGTEVRRSLLDGGLYVGAGTKARNLLTQFLTGVHVEQRAKAVSSIGWYGSAYVLPDGAIGRTGGERSILQTSGSFEHCFFEKGTLADWQQNVSRYAVGNSRLALAISMAFAAAIVGPCGAESGGIHLRGPSSSGKSTTLAMAGSVWGGGDRKGYVKSWRSTSNGLEAVAAAHNDALLCLDELAQVSAKEAGEVAYMLSNGSGRTRASRDTTLRKTAKWRLLFLSSGEIGLSDKIAEDVRGRRATAGQHVRVIDVPADTGIHGVFENLHDFPDAGCFARHLVAAARESYGVAARAFINEIAGRLEELRQAIANAVPEFIAQNCPRGSDGQVERVAGRFGLIAAAGEIATAAGITNWQSGEAITAAKTCFEAWLMNRGGVEAAEVREGINAVRAFLSAHVNSRFLDAWNGNATEKLTNLAGFRKKCEDGDGWDFFVTTEAWPEVAAGFDAKALAAVLAERGLLSLPDSGPHRAKKLRIPGYGQRRVYHILSSIMEHGDG